MSTERVPDFFIVGHHKSGTTAMYEMLRHHPQIFMPNMKEPEFFGREHSRAGEDQPDAGQRPMTYAQTRPQTLAQYLALFAPAEAQQRAGEASPSYLRSSTAAAEIAAVAPDARIIAILREPASFLRSLHLQMLQNRVQDETDLRKAIASEGLAREANGRPRFGGELRPMYTDRVRYVEQLRRYEHAFTPEQVLVLIYDDFRAENVATVRRVLDFLQVDPQVPIAAVDANPTVAARSRTLDRWVRALRAGRGPLGRAAKSSFKALTPRRMQRDVVRAFQRKVVYGSAPAPDQSLMLELRRRFKPEVEALGEYLQRDLVSLWGYSDVE
ncbi:MAG TPA: sulfotransferase [Solirubrobacteraceae bacterium]|nr:sulfotransferase [Solirubrobacteraceae bacterium]